MSDRTVVPMSAMRDPETRLFVRQSIEAATTQIARRLRTIEDTVRNSHGERPDFSVVAAMADRPAPVRGGVCFVLDSGTVYHCAASGAWSESSVLGSGGPSAANYVIYIDGANCVVASGTTSSIMTSNSDHILSIQAAIALAGIGGVLAFRAGNYNLSAPMVPLERQSWTLPFGAVFRPTGDNRCLEAIGIDFFHLYGTIHIEDTDRKSETAEAIYLDAARNCYFQDIFVWDYYRGMTFSGESGRTYECNFQSIRLCIMRHQGLCIWAEVGDNYFQSVFIKGPSTTEWSAGQGLVIGMYPTAYGTVFGGVMFGRVEVLDCQVNIDLQGLYECWFDKILSDNAFGPALYIGDNVQRLFVGTLWTAGSGDGLWIQGSDTNKVKRLFFNTIMSWINAQYGVVFRGRIEGATINTLYCLENQVCQLSYQGLDNDAIVIDNLICSDAPAQGMDVDAGGAGSNCVVRAANLTGRVSALDLLTEIEGERVGLGPFSQKGVAIVANGNSSAVVAHGLNGKPKWVWATPYHAETAGVFITDRNETTFTINLPAATGGDFRQVAWHAKVGYTLGDELLSNPNVDTEGASGEPADWFHSMTAGVQWSTAEYVSAGHSLRLSDNTNVQWWQSVAIAVTEETTYRLRLRILGLGNNFTVALVYWWSAATLLGEDRILLNDNYTFWTERTADFVAPTGATVAEIGFRTLADLSTDIMFDDVYCNRAGYSNQVLDPSAESGGEWVAATPGQTEWVSGDGKTGTRSLRVYPTATADGEWRSNWFTIVSGIVYDAGCWVKGIASGNARFVIRYFSDAGGLNQISEDYREFVGIYTAWTQLNFTFTADTRAQSAEVRLRGGRVGAVAIRGDNFSFRQLV